MEEPTNKAGPGRPPLHSSERRSARVVTMVTQTELQQLRDAAQQQAVSLSALCHDLLVQAVSEAPPKSRRIAPHTLQIARRLR